VKVIRLDTGEMRENLMSDASGRIVLENPGGGAFMLHTIWAEPAEGLLEDADFATSFSSLTLAFAADAG
jgi:hypothetical protein